MSARSNGTWHLLGEEGMKTAQAMKLRASTTSMWAFSIAVDVGAASEIEVYSLAKGQENIGKENTETKLGIGIVVSTMCVRLTPCASLRICLSGATAVQTNTQRMCQCRVCGQMVQIIRIITGK